jgi:predicted TIM-barrel fold metal-dependent hydrolase
MLSRRGFINTTLGAGAALAAQGAQPGSAQAPAAQPARKRLIVDAQVHLWKAETPDWKWVPGMTPQLPEPFTIEKLVPLMTEAGVDRVVVVPPSWPGDRNDYGLEAARRYPDRFHVMGRVTLADPKQAVLLPKWKEQPGMLGVRVTFTRLAGAAEWLTNGTADWFWPAAEKAGLPVMFLAPGNLPAFAKIAQRTHSSPSSSTTWRCRRKSPRPARLGRRSTTPSRSPSTRTCPSSCRRRRSTRQNRIRSAT